MSSGLSISEKLLVAFVSFMGAGLLWSVQPMMARILLPKFGGTAAVWTSALVFYQSALVIGYWYAHWLNTSQGQIRRLHWLVLATSLAVLPIGGWGADIELGGPFIRIVVALTLGVGLPYMVTATTSPWVQAMVSRRAGDSAYALFAWSNLGSIVGLLSYPWIIEPNMGVQEQRILWSCLYAVYLGLLLTVALVFRADHVPMSRPRFEEISSASRLRWIGLSALGVGLLMAVTDAITTDLTISPMLWVIPLFIYLLSLVICFGWRQTDTGHYWRWATIISLAGTIYLLTHGWRVSWLVQVVAWSGILLSGCMLCHCELVRLKPQASALTRYYLDIAIGGAVGGLITAVLLPVILPMRLEIHICSVLLGVLVIRVGLKEIAISNPFSSLDHYRYLSALGLFCLVAGLLFSVWRDVRGQTTFYRSFYGTLKVKSYDIPRSKGGVIHLLDGRISHGFQYGGVPYSLRPTSYFAAESGIGRALSGFSRPKRVGVLGLGVGTINAYSKVGDSFVFFEINPDVITAARAHFSYLDASSVPPKIVIGDGRIELERYHSEPFDCLVIDAFTGDAIPAHLLTEEAMELYLSKLTRDGILAVNISNRHASLDRVMASHLHNFGLFAARIRHAEPSPLGKYMSDWVLLSRNQATLEALGVGQYAPTDRGVRWTDDHAPLLSILK